MKSFVQPWRSHIVGILLFACIAGDSHGAADSNAELPDILEPGDIVLGQSADLSGQYANISRQFLAGANVYFAQLNAQGGVRGRNIKLVSLDDKGDPELAVRNTYQFLRTDKVVALFGYASALTSSAVLPIVNQKNIPFFAPITGSRIVYFPFNRYVFTIRASYLDEYKYLFSHFSQIGLKRLAIFNDAAGLPYTAVMQAMIAHAKAELVASESGLGRDVDKIADNLLQARPDVIMFMSISQQVNGDLIKALRLKGYLGYFYCASLVCSPLLTDDLQDAASGMIISQVVPFPWRASSPIVHEYQQAMLKARIRKFSYLGLEGFIAAKVLAEGLNRAGPNMTREKLISALEGINQKNYKIGGFRINFSTSNHHGSTYVDTTTINKRGTIVH